MFIRPNSRGIKTELLLAAFAVSILTASPRPLEAKRNGAFAGTASVTKGSVLHIKNHRGNIIIRRGTTDFVQVHAEMHDNTDRGGRSGRYTPAEIIAYLERKPPIEQEEQEVRIGTMMDDDFYLGVEINYEIVAPEWVSLEIDAQYGILQVYEVGERIKIDKDSGFILIQEPRGRLKVTTNDGGLQVLGTPHEEWSLQSTVGSVEVFVPADLGFELDAESNEGSLDCEFPLGEHKPGRFKGAINGGGPRIHIRSDHGALAVRQGQATP